MGSKFTLWERTRVHKDYMGVKRDLLFYVYGAGSDWNAICVDLDIAVEAASQHEAMNKIEEVVHTYIHDAMQEAPEVRRKLLNRSSPLSLRFSLWAQYQLFLWRRSRPHDRTYSAVALACPA